MASEKTRAELKAKWTTNHLVTADDCAELFDSIYFKQGDTVGSSSEIRVNGGITGAVDLALQGETVFTFVVPESCILTESLSGSNIISATVSGATETSIELYLNTGSTKFIEFSIPASSTIGSSEGIVNATSFAKNDIILGKVVSGGGHQNPSFILTLTKS